MRGTFLANIQQYLLHMIKIGLYHSIRVLTIQYFVTTYHFMHLNAYFTFHIAYLIGISLAKILQILPVLPLNISSP